MDQKLSAPSGLIILNILTGMSRPEEYRRNSRYYSHISLPSAGPGCEGSTARSPSALWRSDSRSQPGDPQSRHQPPPSMERNFNDLILGKQKSEEYSNKIGRN